MKYTDTYLRPFILSLYLFDLLIVGFSPLSKSDYVKEPISKPELNKIWRKFMEGDYDGLRWLWTPLGGRMNEISEFETPYPHSAGNIYNLAYMGTVADGKNSEKDLDWIRKFYSFMAPYVSKFPRTAYLNFKDLDLGDNKDGASTDTSKTISTD